MFKPRSLVLLVVSAAAVACSNSRDTTSPASPSVFGTLSVQVQGLDSSSAKGGVVTLMTVDVSPATKETHEIPASGALEISVPVGTYAVAYLPPGAYGVESVFPVTAPTAIKVTENASTQVTYRVALPAGSILLIADITSPPWPANGGSASIRRTDIANGIDTTLVLPNTVTDGYYTGLSLLPGTYTITYRPPDGLDVVAGVGYTVSQGTGTTSITIRPDTNESITYRLASKSP
jgi:hypothetical protein